MFDEVRARGEDGAFGQAVTKGLAQEGPAGLRQLFAEILVKGGRKGFAWSWPRGAKLAGLDLREWDFADADDRPVVFDAVDFAGANLLLANFRRAHFRGCAFGGCNLAQATFPTDCRFEGCSGRAEGTRSARLHDCDIDETSRQFRVSPLPSRTGGGAAKMAEGRLVLEPAFLGPILRAVFSADGCAVLIASDDRTARLFDAASGKELRRFAGHAGPVMAAPFFSADGRAVLTASWDKTARLFDAASGKELRRFAGHAGSVMSAVFSADGRAVLTASWDKTARLFDAASGKELRRFAGHERVNSAVFSTDGRAVLTASRDQTARLFDAASGKELRRFSGHEDRVMSAVFSPPTAAPC